MDRNREAVDVQFLTDGRGRIRASAIALLLRPRRMVCWRKRTGLLRGRRRERLRTQHWMAPRLGVRVAPALPREPGAVDRGGRVRCGAAPAERREVGNDSADLDLVAADPEGRQAEAGRGCV